MLRYYFITYAPSSDDNKLFIAGGGGHNGHRPGMDEQPLLRRLADVEVGGGDPVCKVLQILQEVSEYFIFGEEHPTSNIHYHGAGKVKDSINYKDSDWLANKLRPFLPKSSSSKLATRISWIKPKPNESVESQSERSLAYCQKEDKHAFKFNISDDMQDRLDMINREVPDRDPVTYVFPSTRDYFAQVMREIRRQSYMENYTTISRLKSFPDNKWEICRLMRNNPSIFFGNFQQLCDAVVQQCYKEGLGVDRQTLTLRERYDGQYQ